jgi:hypothetical protein
MGGTEESASAYSADDAGSIDVSSLLETAKEDMNRKHATYMAASKVHPTAELTKNLYQTQKESEQWYLKAKETYKILKADANPPTMPDPAKSSCVPTDLLFLQLEIDDEVLKP